ncbi:MAG: PorP/SprF family type IX secretion system membrane protein [Saprospiraceae bacterium]|jgi:type IX secretion system PorP/SprF family membrane protein|nr:PorP/SprF family type IX secretion system membrane protein [Saprospiraceae bacterium]
MMTKYIKIGIITVVCQLILSATYAQQERHYTQFFVNKMSLNPAYAGEDEIGSITAIYRNQWLGFEGAPQSQLVTLNTPLFSSRVGFGLGVFHSKIGLFETWDASMAYSYDLINRNNRSLRIGIQGSIRNFNIDINNPTIVTTDPSDPSLINVDGAKYYGNFGMGLYLNVNKFYFGISSPRFFSNTIGVNTTTNITAKEVPHVYLMTGLTLPAAQNIDVQTNVLGKYVDGAPFNMDVNVNLIFSKALTLGAGYRTGGDKYGDAIEGIVQYLFSKKIGIGVAYDYSLSEISNVASGSIEGLLRINFTNNKNNLKNPRFFF